MPLSDFKLLTKADAAAIFGVCTKTIDNYVREGRLPPPVPFASREYWHPEDFQEFLDSTFRRTKSAEPAEPGDTPRISDGPREAGTTTSAHMNKVARADSNPVVRQQRRQKLKLNHLNAAP